ncbi:Uncharacterised protein [Arachnia propionica]|uniref:Uncharacterized protein n=1 Tax=Arachnia propionica TaxID=1750 RepID=A0A3S4Y5Q7_9ACTN|nr:Uncharacterised protein [Arachnia propionica]
MKEVGLKSQWSLTFEVRKSHAPLYLTPRSPHVAMEPDL